MRNFFALLLERIYAPLGCSRRWRIGSIIIDCILRLDGGMQNSKIARRILARHHDVIIGEYSYGPCFRPGYFPPQTRIGRYTSIADGVRIVNENHPLHSASTHPLFYGASTRHPIDIGNDVWIGYDAVILPGCSRIGDGAVIGAAAVVTKDIPAYGIAVGNPAKVIRFRFEPQRIAELVSAEWWKLDASDAKAHFQSNPISGVES